MEISRVDYIIMFVFTFVIGLMAVITFDIGVQGAVQGGTVPKDTGSSAPVSSITSPSQISSAAGSISGSFASLLTGTTGNGDVAVGLKPHKPTGGMLSVDISVNTHSVELSQFDLKKMATLSFSGKSVTPVDAPVLSGHHNSGVMVFDIGEESISSLTIIIEGIPAVQKRVFEWN